MVVKTHKLFESKNSKGEYKEYYTHTFANVVNGGTHRRTTGNVFPRFNKDNFPRSIVVPH